MGRGVAMELDAATRMPKLPEGYFWKVRRSKQFHSHFAVILVKKRQWWKNTNLITVYSGIRNLSSVNIQHDAQRAYVLWQERQSEDKYVGNYPPDKLPKE